MHPVWRYTWQSSARQDRTKIIPAGEQDCLSFDGQQPDSWGHFQSNAIWSRAVPAKLWGISCHQWSDLLSYVWDEVLPLIQEIWSCYKPLNPLGCCRGVPWRIWPGSAKTRLHSSLLGLRYQEVQWKHRSACCLLPVQEIPVPLLQELPCLPCFLSASLNVLVTYRNFKMRCWEMSLHPISHRYFLRFVVLTLVTVY